MKILRDTLAAMILLQNSRFRSAMSPQEVAKFHADARDHVNGWNPDQRVVKRVLPSLPSTTRSGRVYNRVFNPIIVEDESVFLPGGRHVLFGTKLSAFMFQPEEPVAELTSLPIVQEMVFPSQKKIVETDEVTKKNSDVLSEWEEDFEVKRRKRRKKKRNERSKRRGTLFCRGGLCLAEDTVFDHADENETISFEGLEKCGSGK